MTGDSIPNFLSHLFSLPVVDNIIKSFRYVLCTQSPVQLICKFGYRQMMHALRSGILMSKVSFLFLLWESIGLPDMRSMNHSALCLCISLKGHCELFISESIGTEHNYHLQVEVSPGLCQYFLITNPVCALHSLSWISRDPSDTQSTPFSTSAAEFV